MTAPPGDSPGPIPVAAPSGRGTVLVVDDEQMIRRLAQIILTNDGFRVVEVGTRGEAIEKAKAASPFDLVLLDLTLPDGDGTSLIPILRAASAATRVLVMSGLGYRELNGTACEGFLSKPFTRSSLLTAVHQVLAAPRR